jgi:hypothetical protein
MPTVIRIVQIVLSQIAVKWNRNMQYVLLLPVFCSEHIHLVMVTL